MNRPVRLLALLLAWTAIAAPASAGQDRPTAALFAERMQDLVGRELDHGLRVAALRADGNTLVVVFDGPAGWRTPSETATVEASLIAGMCRSAERPHPMFDQGISVRVDTLEGGRDPRRGQAYTACPGRAS